MLMNILGKMPTNLEKDVELVEGVYPEFKVDTYLNGKLSPVFLVARLIILVLKNCLITLFKLHHHR